MVLTLIHNRNDLKFFKTQVESRASGEWSQYNEVQHHHVISVVLLSTTAFDQLAREKSLRVRSFEMIRIRISDPRSVTGDRWPMNPLWKRIHGFIWSTIARVILDHWSWSGSSQRNASLDIDKLNWSTMPSSHERYSSWYLINVSRKGLLYRLEFVHQT